MWLSPLLCTGLPALLLSPGLSSPSPREAADSRRGGKNAAGASSALEARRASRPTSLEPASGVQHTGEAARCRGARARGGPPDRAGRAGAPRPTPAQASPPRQLSLPAGRGRRTSALRPRCKRGEPNGHRRRRGAAATAVLSQYLLIIPLFPCPVPLQQQHHGSRYLRPAGPGLHGGRGVRSHHAGERAELTSTVLVVACPPLTLPTCRRSALLPPDASPPPDAPPPTAAPLPPCLPAPPPPHTQHNRRWPR